MSFNLNLKTKISLTFTVVMVAILCIIAALTYHYSHKELKKSISEQQTTLINALAQQLDDRLFMVQDQLKRIANSVDGSTLNDPRKLQEILDDQDDQLVFFDAGLLLLTASGEIIIEYPYKPERVGTAIPLDREYFQETLSSRKPFISSPYLISNDNVPVIAFTVPILNTDGSLRAMMIGKHKLWSGKFLSSIANIHIGRTGYLYIIDKHRDIVVHPDKNRILERLKPGSNRGIELALKGFEGTVENINSKGVKGLSSFKQLSVAPWLLCSHYPVDDAYRPLNSAVHYFLLILLGAGIASVLVIRYTMQRMTMPLLRLTEHVSAIGGKQGEDRLVSIDSRDEIGKLAMVFNTMFVEIDNHQKKLDDERIFVENLVMNSAAAIFVLGMDHRIIYWNKALEKLTGYATGDMKGTDRQWEPFYAEKRPTLADVVLDHSDGNLPKLYDNFRPSRLIEGAFQAEGWFRFAATGRHYLFFNASPIKNSEGSVVGVVETLEDFTDSKQIEEMLNDQYRFLQEIIDAIPTPVYYKDHLARYIGCNRAFEGFFGQSKTAILGKTVHNLNQGEYAAEHEKMDRECIRSASNQNYESSLVRSDGAIRDVIVTKAPFYDKKGKPSGLVATFTDITERRAMEEQLRNLSRAVEQSPVSIVITDTTGIIEYVNPKFCLVTGYNKEESIGQNPHILKSGELPSEVYAELWESISNGREWKGEFHNRKKNGELFWEFASISPLFDKDGRITGYLAVKEDITKRKAVEMALNDSEARLNKLVNSAQDAIIMLDPDGNTSMWNEAAVRIFGYSSQEVIGQNLHRLIVPDRYHNQHFPAFEEFIKTGEGAAVGRVVELSGLRKNGDEFPVELALSSVQINGQWHAIGILRDITARKLAEQALAENRAELETKHAELEFVFKWVETAKHEWEQTLDSLRDIVIMIDPDGKIRRTNRLILDLADRSHDDILGADWREILSEAGFIFTSFNGLCGELVHEKSKRLYNLNIYDISASKTEAVTGRVVSINDTTEIRSMTEELQKAYNELQNTQLKAFQQEKLASIGQLAAGVAHEINNPMGFISSNLGTLGKYVDRMGEFVAILTNTISESASAERIGGIGEQRKRLKIDYILEDTKQLIAESQDGAQRVRKIVQDLKSFSRVDEADRKRADINECLDSTINIAWNEIKYVATLTREFGEIPRVLCYPQQINQVFMNLLVNAAHAIEGQGEIRVRTWSDETNVLVAVSDTGRGISPEVMGRIFEPFFTTKEVGKGTGLGLSISYDIIKRHEGDIIVESEVGKGTTFTVRLPWG